MNNALHFIAFLAGQKTISTNTLIRIEEGATLINPQKSTPYPLRTENDSNIGRMVSTIPRPHNLRR